MLGRDFTVSLRTGEATSGVVLVAVLAVVDEGFPGVALATCATSGTTPMAAFTILDGR